MQNPTDLLTKIVIAGPESTGKSTMATLLAKHYQTVWVPEYARYYCAALTATCTLQDEINMFHGQLALEESMKTVAKNNLLFCDTTILTVKIWSDHTLGETPQLVLNEIKDRVYDLYLLLDIDMPWQDDPLREFPNEREHFMQVWHQELQLINANYKVISGLGDDRFKNAVKVVDDFLANR